MGVFESVSAVPSSNLARLTAGIKILALLQSEWVIIDCFSDVLEHTGQDFQAEILLIA